MVGNPWDPWCYYLIGMNKLAMGKMAEAKAAMVRYLDLDRAKFSPTRKKAEGIVSQLARETF
jgi:hypothetical protein